jgi:molybdopterin converting factor subunit 1
VIESHKVQVKLLFFASLKDIVGSRQLDFDVPSGATVNDLLERLEARYPGLRPYRSIVLTSLNEDYVDRSTVVSDGDEVAIFPPVSGGASSEPVIADRPREVYRLTREAIDAREIADMILRPEDGALCIFEGVVRNNSKGKTTRYLEYEAYETMALKTMEEIGEFVRSAWEIGCVAIVHRLGRMEIGETSVAIIITSPHRRASFDACEYAIDRLKKIVPIWKKEFFDDGEVWIEGQQ